MIQYNNRHAAPRLPAAASWARICGGVMPTGGATSAGACSTGAVSRESTILPRGKGSESAIIHAPLGVRDYACGVNSNRLWTESVAVGVLNKLSRHATDT